MQRNEWVDSGGERSGVVVRYVQSGTSNLEVSIPIKVSQNVCAVVRSRMRNRPKH